jgi:hypothetical protein
VQTFNPGKWPHDVDTTRKQGRLAVGGLIWTQALSHYHRGLKHHVACELAKHSYWPTGARIVVPVQHLMLVTERTYRSVAGAVRDLQAMSWLAQIKPANRHTPPEYQLCLPATVAWEMAQGARGSGKEPKWLKELEAFKQRADELLSHAKLDWIYESDAAETAQHTA